MPFASLSLWIYIDRYYSDVFITIMWVLTGVRLMAFKCIMHELKEITGNKNENGTDRKHFYPVSKSHIAPEISPLPNEFNEKSHWANIPPELLIDIIQRVETRDFTWPARRDVIACASVCKSWRDMTKQVVKLPEHCGLLTFPSSLKQVRNMSSLLDFHTFANCNVTPQLCNISTGFESCWQTGHREFPIQCYLKRERSTSSYLLYFGISPCKFTFSSFL